MQKLNVLGSALYIAAHPDDENTRLIAWLANGKKVRTGYLSLTRGEGGQNLIGPELGDALGIIRTQELLEARRIDGGEQFFTRAVDFGYSKSAAESLERWGKQEVLSDVVRVIRMFRPDVIITRFAPDRSAGHGHHEASAILAEEAFDLAGDPKAFPEQLEQGLEVWQPRRLFFNGSTWWKKDLADIAKSDPDWFSVDVGGYDPLLGLSYTEIAGRSRSMHKSQGFGAAETRGELLEHLKLIKGDRPRTEDIFEGIDMTYGRTRHHKALAPLAQRIAREFDPRRPERSLEPLWRFSEALNGNSPGVEDRVWSAHVQRQVDELIAACAGISVEVLSETPCLARDEAPRLRVAAIARNRAGLNLIGHRPGSAERIELPMNATAPTHEPWSMSPPSLTDQPYWLAERHDGRLHKVPAGSIGKPVEQPVLSASFELRPSAGHPRAAPRRAAALERQPVHKWVDRVAGERIRPACVTPVASVIPESDVLIATGGTQSITVEVEALTDSLTGQLNVVLPEGWGTTKDLKLVNIAKRNERQRFIFQLTPTENAKGGPVKFEFIGPKGKADRTLHEIDYPHIMPQVYYTPAEVKLVPLDPAGAGQVVLTTARRVGYVKGAGDNVPQAMEQLGVAVEFIEPSAAKLDELKKYDAIVTGIRAYNTTKGMKELHPLLIKYVEEGGTLIVQYNTAPRSFSGASDFQIDPASLGPHPFTIGRGRVTVEDAPPTFLDPKHPLLNTPNKITSVDFEGWVQERGLYFASDFDARYTPLIAWSDPGEDPLNGAL
ncbi:MAG: PIG-L family deacetylase, partial [Flavobacteriales bacterium]